MGQKTLKQFKFGHLKGDQRDVAMDVSCLAYDFQKRLPDSEEKNVGFEKLLEAMNYFIEAAAPEKYSLTLSELDRLKEGKWADSLRGPVEDSGNTQE